MSKADSAPLLFKREFGALRPANSAAELALRNLVGVCRVEIKRTGANDRRRGFYWVMLNVAAEALTDATGFFWDENLLHDECKRRLKLGDTYVTPTGVEVFRPKSTSNRAMPENERADWTTRCANLLAHWLGVEMKQLMNEARAREAPTGNADHFDNMQRARVTTPKQLENHAHG